MLDTCRICLRSNDEIVNDIADYADIVQKIAQVELILSDDYPKKVCNDCTNDLINADLLRNMLLECNDAILVKVGNVYVNAENEEEEIVLDMDDMNEDEEFIEESEEFVVEATETPKNKEKKPVLKRQYRQQKRAPGPKQTAYNCHHCGSDETDLEFHMNFVHSDLPVEFKCPHCYNTYDRLKGLKQHIYVSHVCKSSHVCDVCGAKFKMPCRLREHKKVVHLQIKSFSCSICSAPFKTSLALRLHTRSHTGEKPYKCEFCTKSYAHYSDWKTHHLSHTGEWRYYCNICNKGFYKPSTLKNHMRMH